MVLELLCVENVGRFASEGLGKIQWLKGEILTRETSLISTENSYKYKKIKIRKGLPHTLPTTI